MKDLAYLVKYLSNHVSWLFVITNAAGVYSITRRHHLNTASNANVVFKNLVDDSVLEES